MRLEVVAPLAAYLLLVMGVAAWTYWQGMRNANAQPGTSKANFIEEYFLGNRSMGGFLLAMTLTTTYISASSFIGGPGAAYKFGLGWVLLAMIQLPTVWLSLGVLGKKFAILARQYQAVTLNDVLYARYGSRLLVWLASACLLVAFFGAMVVQFIGGARLLETAAGVPYVAGLLIFSGTVALYTAVGGFRASVLNDAIQGVVMLLGTFLLLAGVIHAAGGLPQAVSTLRSIDPALVTPYGANDFLSFPMMASFWVLVCFGVVGLPHTAVRCLAYKDSRAMHRGILIGTTVMGVLMVGMHLSGALGRAVIGDLQIPDQVVPTLMLKVLPPFAAGIFLAAPMAAIMSTVNAQLLQSSATLIKDLYLRGQSQRTYDEKKMARWAQSVTLALGFLVLLASWRPPTMIVWLNLLAFGGLQAIFLWPLVLGLYWGKANATGALCSMAAGGFCYVVLALSGYKIFGLHEVVPSLLIGLAAFLVGNVCHRNRTN